MIKTAHIRDSSFHPHIEPGEPNPGKCIAQGPGISAAVSGVQTNFTIISNDPNGKQLPRGGANFSSSFSCGGSVVSVTIVDNNDGTYSCTYTPTISGAGTLTVTCATKNQGNSRSL